jgi:hypothetical protein
MFVPHLRIEFGPDDAVGFDPLKSFDEAREEGAGVILTGRARANGEQNHNTIAQ